MTPAGIEPATFRFVTQYLNHCATAVPTLNGVERENFYSVQSRRTSLHLESARIWVMSWASGRRHSMYGAQKTLTLLFLTF